MKPAHELLKEWRKGRGLTQAKAALACEVSQTTWCEWESGDKMPRVDFAVRLEALTEGAVKVTDWATAMGERKRGGQGDAA